MVRFCMMEAGQRSLWGRCPVNTYGELSVYLSTPLPWQALTFSIYRWEGGGQRLKARVWRPKTRDLWPEAKSQRLAGGGHRHMYGKLPKCVLQDIIPFGTTAQNQGQVG